jgi:hypothetical protein
MILEPNYYFYLSAKQLKKFFWRVHYFLESIYFLSPFPSELWSSRKPEVSSSGMLEADSLRGKLLLQVLTVSSIVSSETIPSPLKNSLSLPPLWGVC